VTRDKSASDVLTEIKMTDENVNSAEPQRSLAILSFGFENFSFPIVV